MINATLRNGFSPHLWLANGSRRASDKQLKEYARKITKPENMVAVVSDMSLGLFDGIQFNRFLSERIFTIMLTGAWETEEMKGVTQRYIMKPIDEDDLFKTILESPSMRSFLKD